MRIGRYRFTPTLWPTLVVLLLLPFLIALGFWQLDRAAQKREWLANLEMASQREALDLNSSRPDYDVAAHRHVKVLGHYDVSHQLLLENQVRDKQAGYLVLTPLLIEGSQSAVLVDRGWLPAGADRRHLPDIDVDDRQLDVRGVADRGPSVGLRMGDAVVETYWPLRLQYMDYDAIAKRLPYPILPYLIRLDPDEPNGYRRDWEPVSEMGSATHLGYAVQWFGLALALAVIFVVVNTKRAGAQNRDR